MSFAGEPVIPPVLRLLRSSVNATCVTQSAKLRGMDSPGKRLRWARGRAKLERSAAVARVQVPYSTYADYENDHRVPGRENAIALGRLFKVPWEWILEGPPGPPPSAKKEPELPVVKGLIGAGPEVELSDELNDPIELPPP